MVRVTVRAFFALFFLVCVVSVGAQSIRGGAVLGGNASYDISDELDEILDEFNDISGLSAGRTTNFGFSVGPIIMIDFTPGFGLQIPLTTTQRTTGYEVTDDGSSDRITFEFTTLAVDFSVLAKPIFPISPDFSFHVLAGPQLSFIIGDLEGKFTERIGGVSQSDTVLVEPDNSVIFGVSAGAGFGYETGIGILAFDFMYYRSLQSAFDIADDFVQSFGVSANFTAPF